MQLQNVVVPGGAAELQASQYVTAKLRQAFCLYEDTMDPVSAVCSCAAVVTAWFALQLVRVATKKTWGEATPSGSNAVPKWVYQCKQCPSHSMQASVTATKGWDAYIIGTITTTHLKHFLLDSIRADDAACEVHR